MLRFILNSYTTLTFCLGPLNYFEMVFHSFNYIIDLLSDTCKNTTVTYFNMVLSIVLNINKLKIGFVIFDMIPPFIFYKCVYGIRE